MQTQEHTLLIFKPDSFQHADLWSELLHEIALPLDDFKIKQMAVYQILPYDCDYHYAEHVGRDYYPRHQEFMTSGPSLFVVVEGHIQAIRDEVKKLRNRYKCENPCNLIHASDSVESADKELLYWCVRFGWPLAEYRNRK